MTRQRRTTVLTASVAVGALLVAGAPAGAQDDTPALATTLEFASDLLLFESDAPARLLAPSDAIASWRIDTAWGETVASAEDELAIEGVEIAPDALGPGYYELYVETGEEEPLALAFAVLPDAVREAAPDSAFGAMTHFAHGWDVDIIPLIARAGITRVRDELYWADVEKAPGSYEIPEDWRSYLDGLEAHGIDPLLVLSFANPLYDDGMTPYTEEGVAAFASYGAALLAQNPGRFDAVEVWNEINGSFCEGPCRIDPARVYAPLLAASYDAVKAVDPEVVVAGGAAVLTPLGFFDDVFERGGLDAMDALVIHPYGASFETIEPEMEDLRALMAAHGAVRPVWATEYGRTAGVDLDRLETAADLVRMLTAMRAADVERIYWYLARDDEPFVGMGLLREPDSPYGAYAPAPALSAFAHLNATLGTAEHLCRAALDPRTFVHRFAAPEGYARVAWTRDEGTNLSLTAVGPVEVRDMFGAVAARVVAGNSAEVALTREPVFIVGALSDIGEQREDRVIADSLSDFSYVQGQAGWSYGGLETIGGAWAEAEVLGADYGPVWGSEDQLYAYVDRGGFHPPYDGYSVARWTSDYAGVVEVRLAVTSPPSVSSEGVDLVVARNGEAVIEHRATTAADGGFTESVNLLVAEGDVLDLAVGPAGDSAFDAIGARLTVLAPGGERLVDDGCR
ncbi:MAG: glycosyl hydrolase [Maricaulaceae bacterium]|jgi:hypothetical protein